MLKTPPQFRPLIGPVEHAFPVTLLFRGDEILVRVDGSPADEAAWSTLGVRPADLHAVGLLDGRYFRTAWLAHDVSAPAGYEFRKLRAAFGVFDEHLAAIAGRACQIAEWARTHRFCGACGNPTGLVAGERCLKCVVCGHAAYPRISPAMMVLVKKNDAMLLARNAASPTRFSALAGFLEAGESVEDAVHREVFEEVGLRVHKLRYFASQPWPFPHSLMIAFTADYLSGEIEVDRNEIAEAYWFKPGDALPEIAPDISVAGALIKSHLAAHWPSAAG